jgi:DNA-binding HxlR family transcriptional regulator
MQRSSFREMNCSIGQSLEVIGEWWSLLIIRDAFLGVTRFDDFQERLGIARNVLNQRLSHLVEEGVFERVAYNEHPPRYDYVLTDKGRAEKAIPHLQQAVGQQPEEADFQNNFGKSYATQEEYEKRFRIFARE